MKRLITGAAAALLLVATGSAAADARPSQEAGARIHLLHGIPDTPVDVEANGENVIEGFEFGDTEDLSALAGQTLAGLTVKPAGTDDVAIDGGDLALPAEGNVTAVAHLDAEGTPTLTVFENDTSAVAAGQGRLVVRHTAAAPAVDVKANGEVAFSNLSNPNEAAADLPAGTVSAEVVPTGADEPVVIGPADLPVAEGSSLIVYAVGSLDGGTIQTLTETIDGLGSAPGAVQTGNSPVDDGTPGSLPWIVAAAAALAAGGALTLRRRSATVPVRDR
jgi:MYXO-CTERM domain-containing protein